MRRFCLNFSFLLAALVVAQSATAQDKLTLNQTYQDVIRLNYNSGSTQIPLPEGEWVLTARRDFYNNVNDHFVIANLVKIENGVLEGIVRFGLPTDVGSRGYVRQRFCDRENILFIEIKAHYEGGDVDCWGINHIAVPKSKAEEKKQTLDYLLERNILVPTFMIAVVYRRADDSKVVSFKYLFNPEIEGIKPSIMSAWKHSDWHHKYIQAYPEKVAYIERLKSWGRKWKPKVDAGFLGKLEATKR